MDFNTIKSSFNCISSSYPEIIDDQRDFVSL
uniref:Opr5 n=1 Tax=Arundo donax TaxID=35708 RepID=A0A0A8XW75_ARUDO